MSRKVFVLGVGMTTFERPGLRAWDYPDMVREAASAALTDAGIGYEGIEQVVAGYVYGESTSGQRAVYELGLTGIPVYNVNNNCSTGSTALFLARQLVAGGAVNCVMAVGFEKMQRGSLILGSEDRTPALGRHIDVMDKLCGVRDTPVAPRMFAEAAREHMDRYGTTVEQLGLVGVKNHRHSVNNPFAQFRDEFTLEQVLSSKVIDDPLTLLQCSPTSDGSAAAVIASEEVVRELGAGAVRWRSSGRRWQRTFRPLSTVRSSAWSEPISPRPRLAKCMNRPASAPTTFRRSSCTTASRRTRSLPTKPSACALKAKAATSWLPAPLPTAAGGWSTPQED